MDIYTRKGDDGTTGLLYGGRVRKDDPRPAAYGDVDEAQSAVGIARAHASASVPLEAHAVDATDELIGLLIGIERDLWVAMAELATAEGNRHKLTAGTSLVTQSMVTDLETTIDDVMGRFEAPNEFVVPGETVVSAHLDLARTIVRRAERSSLAAADDGSFVIAYLNRLSDLLWALARWQEGNSLTTRSVELRPGG
ncbi:MAG: Cob(I)yrinic acid a,c-diamide adenosyltransferase [Verrucomicrobia bacterium ADurb.Bin122]|jgi:cob(I)alamin adenosyltransferase|nr:MAG: Cob(I)yrinic acid a,c-diamide adenosyltransferase [Verrucomicrobia bacterium ADurb.Bin122]